MTELLILLVLYMTVISEFLRNRSSAYLTGEEVLEVCEGDLDCTELLEGDLGIRLLVLDSR